MTAANATNATTAGAYTFRWLLAWAVFLFILMLANRTRVGHVTIYYLLVLAALLLLVTQYRWLANVLAPIASLSLQPSTIPTATAPAPSGS